MSKISGRQYFENPKLPLKMFVWYEIICRFEELPEKFDQNCSNISLEIELLYQKSLLLGNTSIQCILYMYKYTNTQCPKDSSKVKVLLLKVRFC